jgi:23S rRNA (pseudouridine1915-N3)-methyltransferase
MMKLTIIACGQKMPDWVEKATHEFQKRLQAYVTLTLIEIPLIKRTKSQDIAQIMDKEASFIEHAIPSNARVITLEIEGRMFSSPQLAQKIEELHQVTSHLCLIIGGSEGLPEKIKARRDERWSLSPLTLPHPLARIILLESLYRSFAIIHHHPYHK